MDIVQQFRLEEKVFLAETAFHLEGIHFDEVQIADLLNNQNKTVLDLDEDAAIIIRNVIDTLDYLQENDLKKIKIDLDLYIKLNSLLAKDQALFVGRLRDIPTVIGCIKDDIPVYEKDMIEKEIHKLNNINKDNFREIIPSVFCRLSRMQPFFDGNKRSTNFLCNIALMKNNLGLFVINYENLKDFNRYLKDYYQEKNSDILKFIGNNLIINSLEYNICNSSS